MKQRQEFALKAVHSKIQYYKDSCEDAIHEHGYKPQDAQEHRDKFIADTQPLLDAIRQYPADIRVGMLGDFLYVTSNKCRQLVKIAAPTPYEQTEEWDDEMMRSFRVQSLTRYPYEDIASMQRENKFAVAALTALQRPQIEREI